MTRLVTAAVFYNAGEALAAKAFVESQGYRAFLRHLHFAQTLMLPEIGAQGIHLEVHEEDAPAVCSLLEENDWEGGDSPVERCPECGSKQVRTNDSMLLNGLLMITGLIAFMPVTRKRICNICGHKWRVAKTGEDAREKQDGTGLGK